MLDFIDDDTKKNAALPFLTYIYSVFLGQMPLMPYNFMALNKTFFVISLNEFRFDDIILSPQRQLSCSNPIHWALLSAQYALRHQYYPLLWS